MAPSSAATKCRTLRAGLTTDRDLTRSWWPPDSDESIGEERARELVAVLRLIAGPVDADFRQRINNRQEIQRYGTPVLYLATCQLTSEVRSRCVGTVSERHSGDPASSSLQLHRDGVRRWRRDR